jgi:antitoxin CcdA
MTAGLLAPRFQGQKSHAEPMSGSGSVANYAHDSCTLEMHMINAPGAQPDVIKRVAKAHTKSKVTRKPTNVSLPIDLLERARELDVNVSRASERGLREEVQAAEARVWAEKNADFIVEMNARIERDGLPLEEHRMF